MAAHQSPPDLDISIVSAKDLKNINWKDGDLRAYAAAWVDPAAKVTTRVDGAGDTSPTWDETFTLSVKENLKDAVLTVEVYHEKTSDLKKALVGKVTLPLHEVADAGGFNEQLDYSLKLHRPSGRPHGKIKLGVRLRERSAPPSSYPTPAPYGQDYYAPADQKRDWQAYPGYSQYPPYAQAPPAAGYGQPYAAPPNYAYGSSQPSYGPPMPSYGGSGPYSQPGGNPYPSYGGSGPYSQPGGNPYPSYGQSAPYSSAYGMQQQGQAPPQKGSKFGGMGTGLAVGAAAGALGGLALGEYVEHEEEEAAEHQAEEDADRYGGGNDYGDDYGGGDEF